MAVAPGKRGNEAIAETLAAESARLTLFDIEAGCHRVPLVKRL